MAGFTTDITVSSSEWLSVIRNGKPFLLGNGFASLVVELFDVNPALSGQIGLASWPIHSLEREQLWKAELVQIRADGGHCAHLRNYASDQYLQCNANNCTQTDKPSISFTMNNKGNIMPCESDSYVVLDGSSKILKWAPLSSNQTEFQLQKWFTYSVNVDKITLQGQSYQAQLNENKTKEFNAAILREAAKGSDGGIWRAKNFLIVNLGNQNCYNSLQGFFSLKCDGKMSKSYFFHSDGRAFDGGVGMGERNRGIPICNSNGKCINFTSRGKVSMANFSHEKNSRFRLVDGKRLCSIDDDCMNALKFTKTASDASLIFLSICGETESFGTLCQNPFDESQPFSIV